MKKAELDIAEQYIFDVVAGKCVTGLYVTEACKRYIRDVETARDDNWAFYFDKREALKAILFIQSLKHLEGSKGGTNLELMPWQRAIIWQLFGWRRKEDNKRRFKRVYIEVARKNGKTFLASCIALYVWLCEGEVGAQGFVIATKRAQAGVTWDNIKGQILKHDALTNIIDVHRDGLKSKNNVKTFFKALSKDHKSEDGHNPYILVCDEYHAHPTDELLNVMESGMLSRVQPLTFIITTAGFNFHSPCYKERERAIQVANGTLHNDGYLSYVFSLDEDDAWDDENVWVKSNPNLGASIQLEHIKDRVLDAKQNPTKTNEVKTKTLNMWTEVDTCWLQQQFWTDIADEFSWDDMKGRECVIGMDLSAVRDITALCYCFLPNDEDDYYRLKWKYWLPAENVAEREHRDKVSYSLWIERGWIEKARGGSIRMDDVAAHIVESGKIYNVNEIAYDSFLSGTVIDILKDYFDVVPIGQSYAKMAPLTRVFENAIIDKSIRHDGNEVSAWMFACTEMKSDRQDNKMPMKPMRDRTNARIDGIVAAIMAYGRADLGGGERRSYYEIGDLVSG